MPFAVETTFDVAFWFADQALNENEYLQPMKMHRLLYLAQGYYALAHKGKKLMPAVFVADEQGPLEPTVYKTFVKGRPDVDVELFLPDEVHVFLERIWRKFGHLSMEKLNALLTENNTYSLLLKRGRRVEIPIPAMVKMLTPSKKNKDSVSNKGPKMLMTQDGAPVTVQAWAPGMKR